MSGQRAQVVLFASLALIGGGFAVTAPAYGVLLAESRIGPGFLPLVAGLGLALFSVLLLAEQLRAPAPEGPQPGTDDFGRSPQQRMRILRRVFVLLPVAVALVPLVGMVVAFGLLVLVISTWLEGRRPLPALALSAGSAAVIHGVFSVVLQVPLPTGVFGF